VEYLDFDLEVTAADGGAFTVRVLRSPAGEATGTMRLPFDSLVLQNRLQALQIALLRSGTTRRRVETPEAHTVAKFGEELWDALFNGDIRARFEASRSEARRLDAGMRIKLRFEDASLAALPWEYLFDAGRGDYVTLSASTPVVRYIPLPQVMEPLAVRPPLRVLGMIASPTDLDALDVDRERQRLGQALEKLSAAGLVELTWMTGSTARDLQATLRRGPWHIFHFVGHGGFDANRGEGLIVLTTETGTSNLVSATDLGRLLGDHDPLRLAVLNACESGRGDTIDVFASTAATLVRRGTPAVVAMQYEITDDAAIEFSRSFYEAIAVDIPVDAALAEARKGVAMAIPGTLEWGTPVLYMRAPDGVLFDIPAEARAAVVAPEAIDRPPATTSVPPPVVEVPRPVTMPPPTIAPPPADEPAAVGGLAVAAAAVAASGSTVAAPSPPPSGPAPFAATGAVSATAGEAPGAPPAPPAVTTAPPAATSPGAVAGWSAPGGAAGARKSGPSMVLIAGGLVVLVLVAGGLLSVLAGGLPTDSPAVTTDPAFFGTADPEPGGGATFGDGRIVFANDSSGNADLYSVDPAGSGAVHLTSTPEDDRYPAWSPDGSMIAFTRVVDSRGDLWLMAADGSDQRQITEGEANDWAPAWTPDGSALVFSSDRNETDDRSNDLWIVTLDGSDPQLLFGEPNKDEASAVVGLDGARVAFASDREGDARSIYIFDRFANTTTRLTFSGRTDDEPAWTTDGNTVVFARESETNGAGRDIWTVRVGDGFLTQLTTDDADEGHPALAPDGQSYAFQRNIDGSWHILADGAAGLRDVSAGLGGNSVEPTWR